MIARLGNLSRRIFFLSNKIHNIIYINLIVTITNLLLSIKILIKIKLLTIIKNSLLKIYYSYFIYINYYYKSFFIKSGKKKNFFLIT